MRDAKKELAGFFKLALKSTPAPKTTSSSSKSTSAPQQEPTNPIDVAPVLPGPPPAPPRPDLQDLPMSPAVTPQTGPVQRVVTAAVRQSTVEKAQKNPDMLRTIMREGVKPAKPGDKKKTPFKKEKSRYEKAKKGKLKKEDS